MVLLEDALESLARQPLERLTSAELGESLVALRSGIDRLESEFVRRLQVFDRRKAFRADGFTSAIAWLKDRCRLSGGAASTRMEIARELGSVPGAVAAFSRGHMGFSNAAVLSRTSAEIGPAATSLAGAMLVDAAQRLPADTCRELGRQLHHTVDPHGALSQALRDRERRRFRLSQALDGMFLCEGVLDPEGGAALRTALQALDPPLHGDRRSAPQRTADALVELATRQLQAALTSSKGQRPHLVLTASRASLQGRGGERAPQLAYAGTTNTETARRIACDAVVSCADPESGDPRSAARRSVPPSMRRALAARERGCRFPGCDRPESWCDAHHIVHWVDGGDTATRNLVLLCRAHHRFVHEDGWTLTGHGAELAVRPPPRRE